LFTIKKMFLAFYYLDVNPTQFTTKQKKDNVFEVFSDFQPSLLASND